MQKEVINISADTFLAMPAVDTSVELHIFGIKDKEAVNAKIKKLYGEGYAAEESEITIPARPYFDKPRYNVIDAKRVISRLMRIPGGCPWDSVQTHESIRINMIEEAYEAVDAIDNHDLENMREEFGDVLLQSLLQSEIAKRDGEFDFDDVCDGLCKKLISRHTFIFGGDSASSSDDAISLWDKNKAKEKNYTSLKDQLEKLPGDFPSLLRAQKVYKKSKKAGVAYDGGAGLADAVQKGDYAAAVYACVALLADEGKDAEVELNRVVREHIQKL